MFRCSTLHTPKLITRERARERRERRKRERKRERGRERERERDREREREREEEKEKTYVMITVNVKISIIHPIRKGIWFYYTEKFSVIKHRFVTETRQIYVLFHFYFVNPAWQL